MTDGPTSNGPTLKELIQARKGRLTYVELAVAAGGKPNRSRWTELGSEAKPIRSSPDPDLLMGVAKALKVPIEEVWDAVGRSVGLAIEPRDTQRQESPLLASMPLGTEALSPAMVEYILGIVDEVLRLEAAAAGTNVRTLKKAARKKTGYEDLGPRGGRRRTT